MKEKIPIIALVGPTASGKTELGVELAKIYNGEIVSADSMQIYKGMSIATAKPSKEEMQGIPHHMMDFLDLDKTFSAADYVNLAKPIINDIHNRGKQVIIVGGTGLYIDSLLQNITFCKTENDEKLRQELYDIAKEKGNKYLHDMLKELDPIAAENIHMNNVVRVVRAIEVCQNTGKTFTQTKEESRCNPSPYDVIWIGLGFEDRNVLYDRINRRVDIMIDRGLVKEAESVLKNGKLPTASNAIGLKEWQPYFDKTATLEECIYKMKLETRHYAKRQLTWFRRNNEINWIYVDKTGQIATKIESCKKIIAKREDL